MMSSPSLCVTDLTDPRDTASTDEAKEEEESELSTAQLTRTQLPIITENERTLQESQLLSSSSRFSFSSASSSSSGRRWHMILRALLWKNWKMLFQRKNPYSTALELVFPVLCMIVLGFWKALSGTIVIPDGWSEGSLQNSNSSNYESLDLFTGVDEHQPKFVVQETTMTGLLLALGKFAIDDLVARLGESITKSNASCVYGLMVQGEVGSNATLESALPQSCHGLVAPYRLALVPDHQYTRQYFLSTISKWYPRIPMHVSTNENESFTLTVPAIDDLVMFFDGTSDLETYVMSDNYGMNASHPKIYAALVFDEFPDDTSQFGTAHSLKYSIRLSSYAGNAVSTKDRAIWNPLLDHQVITDDYQTYARSGFSTLQTLVTKFLNCLPEWNSTSETTTGVCQRNESVAINRTPSSNTSSNLDSTLLTVLENDIFINEVWERSIMIRSQLSNASHFNKTNFATFNVTELPDQSLELLLSPLRQLPQPYFGARFVPMPVAAIVSSCFYPKFDLWFPLLLAISYLYAISKMIATYIQESESHTREYMRVLGVRDRFVWISWYTTYGSILFISSVVQLLILLIFGVFPNTNIVLILALLCLFAWSVWCCAFCISSFFPNARTGSFVGVYLFITMLFLEKRLLEYCPNGSYFMPPLVMAKGFNVMLIAEKMGIGIGFGNVNEEFEGDTLGTTLGYLLLDCIIYTILGLYFERVIGKGTEEFRSRQQAWYFPLLPSFWKQKSKKPDSTKKSKNMPAMVPNPSFIDLPSTEKDMHGLDESQPSFENSQMKLFGASSSTNGTAMTHLRFVKAVNIENSLCLHRVTKAFPSAAGQLAVLHGVNMALPVGEITCIVGGPKSGKSVLMSLFSLRITCTSGDITFGKLSWKKHVRSVRKLIGFCFQDDVLFSELTVLDHLKFYAKLKHFGDSDSKKQEIYRRMKEFGLLHRSNVKAKDLALGARRKLSLAIALLQSKLIFLDEPTLGMDPYSRQRTWEILKNNRKDSIIAITSRNIDEAEALGDQVAVLVNGQLTFCGTPEALKNYSGMGYTLTLVKTTAFKESAVIQLITSCCGTSWIQIAAKSEEDWTARIPIANSSGFPRLFQQLETQKDRYFGVASYDVSLTKLDDAFSYIMDVQPPLAAMDANNPYAIADPEQGHIQGDQDPSIEIKLQLDSIPSWDPTSEQLLLKSHIGHFGTFIKQTSELMYERLQIINRARASTLSIILLPVIFLFFFLATMGSFDMKFDNPSLPLNIKQLEQDAKQFGQLHLPYYCTYRVTQDDNSSDICDRAFESGDWMNNTARISNSAMNYLTAEQSGDSEVILFGIEYDFSPSAHNVSSNANEHLVRMGEALYNQGYGKARYTSNQFGAYLLYHSTDEQILAYDMYINTSVPHASGIFKAEMDQALYQVLAGNSKLQLEVSNHPLPPSAQEKQAAITNEEGVTVNAFLVMLVLCYFPATIVARLVEYNRHVKHQRLLAGMRVPAFWVANYAMDLVLYFISASLIVTVIAICDLNAWMGSNRMDNAAESKYFIDHRGPIGAVIVLFVLFGFAVCPLAYGLSFFFRGKSLIMTGIKAFLVFVTMSLSIFIVASPIGESDEGVGDALQNVFSIFPFFSFGYALHLLASQQRLDGVYMMDAFDGRLTGVSILYLCGTTVLFFFMVIAIDIASTFPDVRAYLSMDPHELKDEVDDKSSFEDPAVTAEVARIADQIKQKSNEIIQIHNVTKVYRSNADVPALKSISIGVATGECFALLGIKRSGKSTLLKILSGEVLPAQGRVNLNGKDAVWQHKELRESKCIGYCSQHNEALVNALTIQEQVLMHARFKGYYSDLASCATLIDQTLERVGLSLNKSRFVGNLQPHEKRKLSIALALIGNPPIVLLDEPTVGLDRISRLQIWSLLRSMSTQEHQCAMIVATSSLEECEAISSRVGILLDGTLSFLGSYTALQRQFEYGWVVDAHVAVPSSQEVDELVRQHLTCEPAAGVITLRKLPKMCERLGHPDWIGRVDPTHPTGCWLATSFSHDGLVSAQTFFQWWISETQYDALESAIEGAFGKEYVRLLRRQPESCRFQLVLEDSELQLSQVFKVLELAKTSHIIQEYTVSPATFASVMETFARSASTLRELHWAETRHRLLL